MKFYSQTVVLKTEEETKDFNNVKKMFIKGIFEDKAVVGNSVLTEKYILWVEGGNIRKLRMTSQFRNWYVRWKIKKRKTLLSFQIIHHILEIW